MQIADPASHAPLPKHAKKAESASSLLRASREERKESEARYRGLLEAAPDAMVVVDGAGEIVLLNLQAEKQFGYNRDELVGQKVTSIIPTGFAERLVADDLRSTEAALAQVMGTGIELVARRKDGSEFPIEIMLSPLAGAEGILVTAAIRDISVRKAAEEELRESEDRFRYAFEHAILAKSMTLPSGQMDVNDAFLAMVGYTRAEMAEARTWQQISHPDDLARTNEIVASVLSGARDSARFEKRYLHKNGSVIWADVSTSLRRDSDGLPSYFMTSILDITERRRVQEELRASNAHLEEAQRMAHLGSWDWDPAADEISGSEEFFRLFDAVPEEILRYGQFAERVHPDDRERVNRDVADALAANRPYDTEYRVRLRDGGWRDINALGHLVADPDGKPPRFVGTCLDITERKRADDELRLSQARYKTIVDNIPQKVFVKGPDLRWVSVNGLLARDFGLRPENVVGKTNGELFPQDLADKYSADDQRIVETGVTEEFDEEYPGLGERRIVHTIKAPVRDHAGAIEGVLGVFWDVTDERRAQGELRAANQRLRRFVDSAVFGYSVSRADGSIVEANDYYLDVVGYSREELERGEIDWRMLTPDEWLPADERAKAEALERGTCSPYEKEYVRRDGSRVSVILAHAALPDSQDLAAFVLDISQRKSAEDRLRQASEELAVVNAELEERVTARTAELEAANRELEAFSYSVSHDLRAPLRSIDAFSHILLKEHAAGLDDEAGRLLGIVVRNARQMGHLIDDLLAFSRVTRQELERRPIDMERIALSVTQELSAAEPAREIAFDIGPLGQASGDQGLMRQVWTNLLANAVKFTRPVERPRIDVRCERRNGEFLYSVRDNGVGFDPAYMDKLFKPFQRLHQTADFEGTGIGLAIVAQVVRRHGGRVWAEGAPGAGATFGFSLPEQKETT